MIGDVTVVGTWWIGRNFASSVGVEATPQRQAAELVVRAGGCTHHRRREEFGRSLR